MVSPHLKKTEYLKNNYPLLTIKLLIVILFVITLYIGFNRIYDRWYFDWISDSNELLSNGQFLNSLKSDFRPTLIVLIPLAGIFTSKKIGWFLITSYFYMMITKLSFSSIQFNTTEISDFLLAGAGIIIFTLIVIVMNTKNISTEVYGFTKRELITKNIVASIIGMIITVSATYIRQ